jgi:NADPH:quinone reductase-like Zn-dependent oxidoreductase
MEAAGTVVAVGKNVTDLKPGQAVWTSGSNSFGSLINAPKVLTYALPTTATFPTAATCQVAYATAHRGLVDMANVQKGEP